MKHTIKTTMVRSFAFLVLVSLVSGPLASAWAMNPMAAAQAERFSDDELDELLSPIALYPDPLLAQLVPASTFIDQLEDAQGPLFGARDGDLRAERRERNVDPPADVG